jgi:hypothetical protein
MMLAVALLSLTGCGGGIRLYRGTITTARTASSGGFTAVQTTSTTFALASVLQGSEPNDWVFELGDNAWNATTNGTTITFTAGQVSTTTVTTSGSSTTQTITDTLTSGSGTLDQQQLSINLAGTSTSANGGNTSTSTFQQTFAGVKE